MIDKKLQDKNTRFEKIYHDAGQFYWGKVNSWLKEKFIFSKKALVLRYQDTEQ